MSVVWIDGRVLPLEEARVSPLDHGLLTGDGVFETMRVYRGVPFAVRRHLDRLARSAAGTGLPMPERGVLGAAMEAVVVGNDLQSGRLRITVTGGVGSLGSDRAEVRPTVIVAGAALPDWPPTADVVVVPWPRNELGALAGIKTVSYGENVVALAHARARGAGEALFANLAANLCEGTGTNVFVGLGGRLFTPPLSAGCLAGVTRELVMESIDVIVEDLPVLRLAEADEAFLTSSTREVQAIRALDGRVLPATPGPLTTAAAAAYAGVVAADLDP